MSQKVNKQKNNKINLIVIEIEEKSSSKIKQESTIQELREIQKSQIALIKAKKSNYLPNQIDEKEDKIETSKITDIFNTKNKEKNEPEKPPQNLEEIIQEKEEESNE